MSPKRSRRRLRVIYPDEEEIELRMMDPEEGTCEEEIEEVPSAFRGRSMFYTDDEEEIEEPSEWDQHITKIAALRASPGIVSIVSHNVPEEMTVNFHGYTRMEANRRKPKDIFFCGCGMIIESGTRATGSNNSQYLSTILAPASLFQHYTTVDTDTDIDVFGSTGVLYKAQLLACDLHYNLAAISIISDSPLPTVTLKHIDDTLSIHSTDHLRLLTPDNTSTSFKVAPKTQIFSVWRGHKHPCGLTLSSGSFSSSWPWKLSCNELYQINGISYLGRDGGPALDPFGQVIGIIFKYSSFLPSNIVSRWWNHYKSSGGFRRPFVGLEVANLYDSDSDFQTLFKIMFPEISAAVVVTKVKKDSPAHLAKIRIDDVIVMLDDKLVQSKLQFYETIWEKVGKAVTVTVFRVTDCELNLSLVIEETPPNKFHKWPRPDWRDAGAVGVPKPIGLHRRV